MRSALRTILLAPNPNQRAIALLRRKSATVWLPGVGTVQGLQANNYLLSDGSTGLTAVDGLVGLDLDAMGSLGGVALENTSGFTKTADSWVAEDSGMSQSGVSGKTFRISFTVPSISAGSTLDVYQKNSTDTGNLVVAIIPIVAGGSYSAIAKMLCDTAAQDLWLDGYGFAGTVSNLQVREITGIHALQATTANKPTLRRGVVTGGVSAATGPYWLDTTAGTKTLGATFPAGHESDIVIKANRAGTTIATAQNITGAYTWNTDDSGLIIIPGTIAAPAVLTAGETALLLSYANRLAGL